jgi:hypothetical protein
MEAARTSETLVDFYQTTRCYNPEDSNLLALRYPTYYSLRNNVVRDTTDTFLLFVCFVVRSTDKGMGKEDERKMRRK